MAMQILSAREFEAELEGRGCQKVGDHPFGSEWKTATGRVFLVPYPEEEVAHDGAFGYPDWMLDGIIEQHKLPIKKT